MQPVTPPPELCGVSAAEAAMCGCFPAAGGEGAGQQSGVASATAVAPAASQAGGAAAAGRLTAGTVEVRHSKRTSTCCCVQ